MEYHIGDVVKIRSSETMWELYATNKVDAGWNEDMDEFCGQIFAISCVKDGDAGYKEYLFEGMSEDMSKWTWTEDMFDIVVQAIDAGPDKEFLDVIFSKEI